MRTYRAVAEPLLVLLVSAGFLLLGNADWCCSCLYALPHTSSGRLDHLGFDTMSSKNHRSRCLSSSLIPTASCRRRVGFRPQRLPYPPEDVFWPRQESALSYNPFARRRTSDKGSISYGESLDILSNIPPPSIALTTVTIRVFTGSAYRGVRVPSTPRLPRGVDRRP